MKADGGLEIGAVARELQHHRAAEAETDRGQPARIDLRHRGERRQRGAAAAAQRFRCAAEFADQFCNFRQIARLPAVTVHVGGERHIAELRQPARPLHDEFAEAEPLVKHQHARLPSGPGLVKGKIAAHVRVGAVIDVLRLHRSGSLTACWLPNRNFTPV